MHSMLWATAPDLAERRRVHIRRSGGFSMIEVLVAILIFSFALVGLALLQSMSVKTTRSASFRSQATTLAYMIIDSMRANRAGVLAGGYFTDYAGSCPNPITGGDPSVSATPAAARDLALWQTKIACTLPGGKGQVHFPGNNVVEVSINWTDANWMQNTADQASTFVLTTTL